MKSGRTSTDGVLEALVVRWEADRLFAAEEAMKRLLDNADYQVVLDLIDEGRENALTRLIDGPPQEQAQYAQAMGMLAGFDVVRKIPRVIQETSVRKREHIESRNAERERQEAGA